MTESFITRELMSAALQLRDVQPRHRALALFVSELEDEQFWEQLHALEAREAAREEAAAREAAAVVETVPALRVVK